MVTNPTPTLGLSRPPFNITTWHDDVNGNMAIIDAALAAFGVYSNVVGTWENGTAYEEGDKLVDEADSKLYLCLVDHTSAGAGTFAADRLANPSYWQLITQGYVPRGEWVTATEYFVNDMVFAEDGQLLLVALTNHTSGVLATDMTNDEWLTLFDITSVVTDIETIAASLSGLASITPDDKRLIRGDGATFVGFDPAANVSSILEAADYAAIRTLLSVYSASATDAAIAAAIAAAAASYQPLDSDLTAIAALVTTAYGRGLLTSADAPALVASLGISTVGSDLFLHGRLGGL